MTDSASQTLQGRASWLVEPISVLFDPVGAMPRAVQATRWVVPLLLTMVLTAAASAAIGVRLDASRIVIPKLAQSGELAKASEREVSEQVEQAQRVAIVGGVAKGVLGVPVLALIAAAALWVWSWLLGGKATFLRCLTAVTLTLWPFCCSQAVTLASALRQPALSPRMASELVPSSVAALVEKQPEASRGPPAKDGPQPAWKPIAPRALLGLVDFFHLWAALLFGLGLSAAANLPKRRAVPAGVLVYVAVFAALTVGLPNLMTSGGPP